MKFIRNAFHTKCEKRIAVAVVTVTRAKKIQTKDFSSFFCISVCCVLGVYSLIVDFDGMTKNSNQGFFFSGIFGGWGWVGGGRAGQWYRAGRGSQSNNP